mmetsp:Transcript_17859/g.26420  ORF Transcript_17859/g.26420 Transcript_17859/m.26420 type:complete len:599 (+) Transcript_17859:79-1875(+)|eukprot:CAMPEP_0194210836 /NCGR_PEP_ID=MMETSP0156-20130528/9140_1 /TAXON_ID=33649 /ORGANISM="Thalassionema nitzschioides, Strain L26-B" /LENGTH=598 /DNA_ID=CAMNT_0038938243 /DNA_START=46 /DNA_END=1842 /DNA_ORIENTATION=-
MNDEEVPHLVSVLCESPYEVIGSITTRKTQNQPLLRPISPVTQMSSSVIDKAFYDSHNSKSKLLDQDLNIDLVDKEIRVELRPKSLSPVPMRRKKSQNSNASTTAVRPDVSDPAKRWSNHSRATHGRETKSSRSERRIKNGSDHSLALRDLSQKSCDSVMKQDSNSTMNSKPSRGRSSSFSERPEKQDSNSTLNSKSRRARARTRTSNSFSEACSLYDLPNNRIRQNENRSSSATMKRKDTSNKSDLSPRSCRKITSYSLDEGPRIINEGPKSSISQVPYELAESRKLPATNKSSPSLYNRPQAETIFLNSTYRHAPMNKSTPLVSDGPKKDILFLNGGGAAKLESRNLLETRHFEMIDGPKKDHLFLNDRSLDQSYQLVEGSKHPTLLDGPKKDLLFLSNRYAVNPESRISPIAYKLMQSRRVRKSSRIHLGGMPPRDPSSRSNLSGHESCSSGRWGNSSHSQSHNARWDNISLTSSDTQDDRSVSAMSCDEQYESRKTIKSRLIKDAVEPRGAIIDQDELVKEFRTEFNVLQKIHASQVDSLKREYTSQGKATGMTSATSSEFEQLLKVHSKQKKSLKRSKSIGVPLLRKIISKSA